MTHNGGHVHGQLRTAPVKPRAVLWDLFGDHLRYVNGGTVPMRALTALLDGFGIGESTSRVALARMRREGWFSTDRDGRQAIYRLTARSVVLLDEGRSRIFDRGRVSHEIEAEVGTSGVIPVLHRSPYRERVF